MIGGKAPSIYLEAIQSHKQVGLNDEAMNAIISSHRIDSSLLRANDFDRFFINRRNALLDIVEQAMGKSIDRKAVDEASDDQEDEVEQTELSIVT
jgi:hypothetical protein